MTVLFDSIEVVEINFRRKREESSKRKKVDAKPMKRDKVE